MQIGLHTEDLNIHCSVWPTLGHIHWKRERSFIFLLTDAFSCIFNIKLFLHAKTVHVVIELQIHSWNHCTYTMYLCELLVEYSIQWMLVIYSYQACKIFWHWKNLKAFHKFWSKLCLHFGIPEISSIVNFSIHQQYILATMKAPVKKTLFFCVQINIYNFLFPQKTINPPLSVILLGLCKHNLSVESNKGGIIYVCLPIGFR